MPKFEVFIPASDTGGLNLTFKVGADNWMAALKAGLQKLGEQGTVSQNVMVDIQDDDSIHVTEAHSGRVFRIRELSPDEALRAQVKRPSGIRPLPPPPPPPRPEPPREPAGTRTLVGATPLDQVDPGKTLPGGIPAPELPTPPDVPAPARAPRVSAPRPVAPPPPAAGPAAPAAGPAAPAAAAAPAAPPPATTTAPVGPKYGSRPVYKSSPRIEVPDVEELVQPVKPVSRPIGRPKSGPAPAANQRQLTEDILADIFLRVVELDRMTEVGQAMDFILDLALEKVPCESGSVFRADGTSGDLTFITARGPKAKEVLSANIVIPAGTGIAGFCAVEGVSVAVNNVEKDPRFYAKVSQKVDYQPRSMLCAPMMTHGRSFGCVQLINRKDGPQFQEHEVGVLAYLAHQAALFMNDRLLR